MVLGIAHFKKLCQEEMFNRLDSKANGDLTLEQLVDGAKTDPDFQSRLPLG